MRHKEMSYESKLLEAEEDDNRNVGRVRALVSVFGNVDHQGDKVMPGAFSRTLRDWRKRGDPIPFIWSHQWGDLNSHIGWVPPEMAEETDKGLEVTAYLPLDDPYSSKAYRLMKSRRLRQFSFAFDVEDEKVVDDANQLRRVTLYECGPCLLGANSDTDLLEVAARGKQVTDAERAKLRQAVALIQSVMGAGDGGDDEEEEDSRKVYRANLKAAIPSHSTETSENAWDGPANEAAIPNDAGAATFRRMFAWVDSDGDPEVKASYRFIHHFANSRQASVVACRTGIAVLNGARGGTTIPASDKSGVYAHLAKHLRDADVEPPELASIDNEARATMALLEMIADR